MKAVTTLSSAWRRVADQLKLTGPQLITVSPPPLIKPGARCAWQEKNWRCVLDGPATRYIGVFRVHASGIEHAFDGQFVVDQGHIQAYCADPPRGIRSHPKGPCFQLVTPPWFRIHWARPPGTIDEALFYVERILTESLALTPR